MCQLLILTEEETNLAATYADVTSGNVLIGTDVTIQLIHEGLAEAHNLSLALTTGREVRTALTAAHRQCGQRVLEGLLESKELQNTKVYRFVITQTAFVRANSVVVLDAVAHVSLDITLVIHPSDTEFNHTIGNAKTLDEVSLLEFGVLVVLLLNGGENLRNSLDVLRLIGESLFEIFNNLCCVHNLFTLVWLLITIDLVVYVYYLLTSNAYYSLTGCKITSKI